MWPICLGQVLEWGPEPMFFTTTRGLDDVVSIALVVLYYSSAITIKSKTFAVSKLPSCDIFCCVPWWAKFLIFIIFLQYSYTYNIHLQYSYNLHAPIAWAVQSVMIFFLSALGRVYEQERRTIIFL
jgi:hypothetical protein